MHIKPAVQASHFRLAVAVPSNSVSSPQMLQKASMNRHSNLVEAVPWCVCLLQVSQVQQPGDLFAAVPDGILIVLLLQVDLPHISPLVMHSHLIQPVPCSAGALSQVQHTHRSEGRPLSTQGWQPKSTQHSAGSERSSVVSHSIMPHNAVLNMVTLKDPPGC